MTAPNKLSAWEALGRSERYGQFKEHLGVMRSEESGAEARRQAMDRMANEFRARREYWTRKLLQDYMPMGEEGPSPLAQGLRRSFYNPQVILLIMFIAGAVLAATLGWESVFLFMPLLLLTLFIARKPKVGSGLQEALRLGLCPDCGYDLSGAPRAVHPSLVGVDMGPERCPECGTDWPCLPPPVAERDT